MTVFILKRIPPGFRIFFSLGYIVHYNDVIMSEWARWRLQSWEPRFTNGVSIAIQIRWKIRFTLTLILMQWSLQNFVHGTIVSCAKIWCDMMASNGITARRIFHWLNSGRKIVSETGPSLTIVYSTVYSGTADRKNQSSASLAFLRGIHRWPGQ